MILKRFCLHRATLAFVSLFFLSYAASAFAQSPGVPWRAVDELGRELKLPDAYPAPREDRKVGLFYFLWLDDSIPRNRNLPEGENGPYDVSKAETLDPNAGQNDALMGSSGEMHFWGEPVLGYYVSRDPFVLRRHLQLIADAGVDVLIFDVTNGPVYRDAFIPLCEILLEARARGERAPQVAFMTHTRTAQTVQRLWDEFYSLEKYRSLFFQWKGKTLLLANPEEVPEELREHFTLRDAYWPTSGPANSHDAWRWVDAYPQGYSWHDDERVAEQLCVSPAQNIARDSAANAVWMGERIGRGRSFVFGKERQRLSSVEGLNFKQQWERALEVDPEFLMITGWNEWIAGRWRFEYCQRYGFVDQYDLEYSRDCEPARGLALDAYYLQMIDGIRRYKGVARAPERSPRAGIDLDAAFDAWDAVVPTFLDRPGDAGARDFPAVGGGRNVASAAKNDLIAAKATRDDEYAYFFLETQNPVDLTPPEPLALLLDLDDDLSTGWRGAEALVGAQYFDDETALTLFFDPTPARDARAELERLVATRNLEDYPETQRLVDVQRPSFATDEQRALLREWDDRETARRDARTRALELVESARRFRAAPETARVKFRVEGNKLVFAVPLTLFSAGTNLDSVSFKWLSSVPTSSTEAFYNSGDVAPEGAFFYRVEFERKP